MLTLDSRVIYQVEVPGVINKRWIGWDGVLFVEVEFGAGDSPVTSLTFSGDQAGLHGFLRRLYSLGLPILSVNLSPSTKEARVNNEY